MERALRSEIQRRANDCCEYCLLPQEYSLNTHEVDHIISQKHNGKTDSENLALACFWCNNGKGPNISGIDPVIGEIVRLFHPRVDEWETHFEWNGPVLVGLTPIGRATIHVLNINVDFRILLRESLMLEGDYPSRPETRS